MRQKSSLDKPAISIIVPVFNEEKAVRLTITSLLKVIKKEKHPFEIIVVDDGSIDRSSQILKSLARKNKKVKIISHGYNRGYGTALKTGIKNANYDWILITEPCKTCGRAKRYWVVLS